MLAVFYGTKCATKEFKSSIELPSTFGIENGKWLNQRVFQKFLIALSLFRATITEKKIIRTNRLKKTLKRTKKIASRARVTYIDVSKFWISSSSSSSPLSSLLLFVVGTLYEWWCNVFQVETFLLEIETRARQTKEVKTNTDTDKHTATTAFSSDRQKKKTTETGSADNKMLRTFFRRILLVAWSYKLGNSKTF